jgi:tetratricopeptide (TPR) repeat protein
LANGYFALFNFKKKESNSYGLFQKTELDIAKDYYLRVLKKKSIKKDLLCQIYVNLANCLDKKGRVVDALDYYEEALKLKPNFAMALGKKGRVLADYSIISGEHQSTFLREAYYLISQALKLRVLPKSTCHHFEEWLKYIERLFTDKKALINPPEYPGYTIQSDSKIEYSLIKFCLKNKLYLNICNYCQKCNAAIGDPVLIKGMIGPLGKDTSNDIFLKLSGHLNQIKQDFVTARFLLFLSRYNELNLNFVDKHVIIIDTLDYRMHNIYIELVKSAFKNFYNILDKIACFINDYLNLLVPDNEIHFSKIWYSDFGKKIIQKKIQETKNYSLNAIFDIHRDLEKGGQCYNLRKTRNALTHRFIKVRMLKRSEDAENMTEDMLVNSTLKLAKIVRNSIIYLLQFIDIEETKKVKNSKGPILHRFAIDVPDDLKSGRQGK